MRAIAGQVGILGPSIHSTAWRLWTGTAPRSGLEGGAASIRKMGSFCQNLTYIVRQLLYNRRVDCTICVKAANRHFAPRERSPFISVEPRKLVAIPGQDPGQLGVPLKRRGISHFLDQLASHVISRIAIKPIQKRTCVPDGLHISRRPVRIRHHANDRLSSQSAHAVEINLSFANPTRPLERVGLGIRAGNSECNCLRLRRERRLAPNGNSQSVAQCVLCRTSLARLRLGTRACFGVGAVGAPLSNRWSRCGLSESTGPSRRRGIQRPRLRRSPGVWLRQLLRDDGRFRVARCCGALRRSPAYGRAAQRHRS